MSYLNICSYKHTPILIFDSQLNKKILHINAIESYVTNTILCYRINSKLARDNLEISIILNCELQIYH